MNIKISNFKLGLFIISGTTLLVVLIVMFGAGVFSAKGLVIETYIDGTVDGLSVGSPLKYRGVKFGRVTEIGLLEQYYPVTNPDVARYVLIRMEVDPSKGVGSTSESEKRIASWVSAGMRLRNASQGLTGVGFMEADFIKKDDDIPMEISWKPEVPYIPSTRTQLARVVDTIEEVARDLHAANIPEVAGQLNKLLITVDTALTDADLKEIGKRVRESLVRIDKVAVNIDEITSDPQVKKLGARASTTLDHVDVTVEELRGDIHQLSDELNGALKDTRETVTAVHDRVSGPEIDRTLERLSESVRKIDTTLTAVESSFERKDQQVDLIISDLRAVSASMRDLTRLLSQYPSLAAFGESPTPSEVYKK